MNLATTYALNLSREAALLLEDLYAAAIEEDALCMQAPVIWDGNNNEDIMAAKQGCNGVRKTRSVQGYPPCPLRNLCLQAALAAKVTHGVWGGTSVIERKHLKAKLRKLQS
jgi:hypothetical protein